MSHGSPSIEQFTNVAEAAMALGHRTYTGTVAATERLGGQVTSYTPVAEAALDAGHPAHSDTTAATGRSG